MMLPFDTNLIKHPAPALRVPSAHEREAHAIRRKARRKTLAAFAERLLAPFAGVFAPAARSVKKPRP